MMMGMYLGTASITRLDILLKGYSLARREVGLAPTQEEREFDGFQSWVQEKYGIKSEQSWAKIILFYSIDEQEALERFFELFEEYLNQNKSQNQATQLWV
jgi:Trp operon repressor